MRSLRKRVGSRARRERGATLVEYALILAVVVVGAIGGIRFLATQSSDEVADQADCVSTRPPPPSCIRPIVATTTTVIAPTTTETTEAPTTTTTTEAPPPTEPPTTEPPPTTEAPTSTTTAPTRIWNGDAEWDDLERRYPRNGGWYFRIDANLNGARGVEDEGVRIVVSWTISNPANGGTGTVECVTADRGRCELRLPVGNSAFSNTVQSVRLEYVTIDGQLPPAGAAVRTVNR